MKREIKFRWWDDFNKKMVPDCRYGGDSKGVNDIIALFRDDLILMQYTGFKDKNGTDIYEGDIVCYKNIPDPRLGPNADIVEWTIDEGNARIELVGHGFMWKLSASEVIGNIYEDPGLLKASP